MGEFHLLNFGIPEAVPNFALSYCACILFNINAIARQYI
jgi:hypothetical protein